MLRTIQLTFLAAGLVAMSALAASAAQNPHSAQSGAKPTKQMSSGANANGTAQNMGSSHKQKQMGARAEGGSKTGKNITASEKHRLATSGGSTGVSVSGGHYRSRTSVYSYNEEPNVIVRRHGHDHVIYGENEPSVTISKSKRRHYYGTAYAPGVTTYGYRHRHLYGSSSSASIGVSKSESISRSKTRVGSAGTISKSSSSKSRNAANGAGFKGRTMAKGNEMSGGPNKHSKSSSLAQGKRTGMNQSSGSNQGSAPRAAQ